MSKPRILELAEWSPEVFGTLFAHLWYDQFPVGKTGRGLAGRADWTLHIGTAVARAAWLMGLRCHHESGQRSDAVFKDAAGRDIASLEWEWDLITCGWANEVDKLKEKVDQQFVVLISYCKDADFDAALESVRSDWARVIPLLLVVIHSEGTRPRTFLTMSFHCISNGRILWTYEQEALPWKVPGTFWTGSVKDDSF